MQQFLNVWVNLDLRRQLVVIGASVAIFMAILAMARVVNSPSMALLYSGLDNGAAGDVVRELEQRSITYEVRGGSIFVDGSMRDELRLTLASEGLPANTNRGYELLDSLSGFGTTSQMFDAAYWRAKEGELARTIVASPYVAMARVHIATTGNNPFQRGVTPKASVSVAASGTPITAVQAKSIRYLVASAVSGLAPEDVAIIDAEGNLLGISEPTASVVGGEDKAQILREKVARLLEARVGFGNAVVEVSVDTVTDREAIRERRFDPEGRVAISTETEETSTQSNEAAGGDVTVASNLPEDQAGNGEGSSSQNQQTRERINYEISETEREVIRAPGAIKRLTVAVLVNDVVSTTPDGAPETTPRSEAELASLEELIASAVGFDAERGDIITIKSMQLQSTPTLGTEANTSFFDSVHIDLVSAIQMAVLAIVALVLGLFVVRPVLSREVTAPVPLAAPESPVSEVANNLSNERGSENAELPTLIGELAQENNEFPNIPAMSTFGGNSETSAALQDPVERLRNMIGERQEETVEILRTWLEEKEESA